MDPYEQRLRDEVIYLHSLWRQGPPRTNPNPINPYPYPNPTHNSLWRQGPPRTNPNPINPYPCANPNPNPNPTHNASIHLHPSNSTQFKKERKNPRGKRGGKGQKRLPVFDPPPVSDIEWPCKPPADTPPATTSGWPNLKPHSTLTARLPSAEEQARFAANQAQQKALKAAQEFFASNADSDGDGDDSDEDGEDEDGCEEYKFFLKVFMEDIEFRGYYEKNYENGEFCCLVCGGVGKKAGKRFKDCVALVQHSIAIAKTKKRWAHRAYGQAICKVLGWDIDRLPTIVLSLGDSLGSALAKSGELQGNADNGGKDDLNVLMNNVVSADVANGINNSNAGEDLSGKTAELSNPVGGELMVCENSLMVADANKNMEDLDKGRSSMVERNAEGVVNCLEPLKEDGDVSVENEIKESQKDNAVLDGLKEDNGNQN